MDELISIAVLVATLFGGSLAAEKIFVTVREAALTKAAHGLPRLAPFTARLTSTRHPKHFFTPAQARLTQTEKSIEHRQ